MDIEPSSSELAAPAESSRESDEEVLAWARRRGYVSFLFFFLIAAAVAVVWVLTR